MTAQRQRVAIVTDSTSSLTPAAGRELGIHVIPIYVHFGTETYRDGVDLDADGFYRLLRRSARPPTTSQPTMGDFAQVYAALSKQAEAVVSIHLSSQMSSTVNAARMASRCIPGLPVYVVDSRSVSMGLGLMVLAAARAAAAGESAAAVVQLVQRLSATMHVIFTVDSLHYLHKGGRIGTASRLMGSLLSIKPVLGVSNGQIEPLEKTRTRQQALERLLDLMAERVADPNAVHAAVFHCAAPDRVRSLADGVASLFECEELITAEAGPIIGTHAGPGTLGVAFYAL